MMFSTLGTVSVQDAADVAPAKLTHESANNSRQGNLNHFDLNQAMPFTGFR